MAVAEAAYVVDAADRIVAVDDAYVRLAQWHGRPELGSAAVGCGLADFIAGAEVRELWRTLLSRARVAPAPLRFHYRCDAPEMTRLALMELRRVDAAGAGSVELRTRFARISHRAPQPLLDRHAARDERMLRACAWCNRFDVDGWAEVEVAVERLGLLRGGAVPSLTHGICAECETYLLDPTGADGPPALR
jgi:hypothetical protein